MNKKLAMLSLCSVVGLCAHAGFSAGGTNRETSSDETVQAMKRIIIPGVEFNQTSIRDVVSFLMEAALTNDPEKKGVNIVLQGAINDGCTNDADQMYCHNVTLSARYISLYNALRIATSVMGLKCRIKGSQVVLMDRDDPDGAPIDMRMYSVKPVFGDVTRDFFPASSDVKQSFKMMGVSWPKGSQITYNPVMGKVIVANTEENHLKIKNLLRELDVIPMQVQLTAQFFRLDSTNIPPASLGSSGADIILALCTNGTGRLIAAPTIIMASGGAACLKRGAKVCHPAECIFTTGRKTNETARVDDEVAFATCETGVSIEVRSTITHSCDSILLEIKGSIVENPIGNADGRDMRMNARGSKNRSMEQPCFRGNRFDSTLTVSDGRSVLAFGGMPTEDGKGLIYCVITVRIVGNEGRPAREYAAPAPPDFVGWSEAIPEPSSVNGLNPKDNR
jgi:hypothetical protein